MQLKEQRDGAPDARATYESLVPRFAGKVPLSPAESLLVRAGQTGRVRVYGPKQSLLAGWERSLSGWVRARLATAEAH